MWSALLSGCSGPPRHDRVVRRRDPLALGRLHFLPDRQQLVAARVADVLDDARRGEHVARAHRAVMDVALLAVHDERVVETQLGVTDGADTEPEAEHRE